MQQPRLFRRSLFESEGGCRWCRVPALGVVNRRGIPLSRSAAAERARGAIDDGCVMKPVSDVTVLLVRSNSPIPASISRTKRCQAQFYRANVLRYKNGNLAGQRSI